MSRSKKTVLSVRIEPSAKGAIDVISGLSGKSLPAIIEGFIAKALDEIEVSPCFIDAKFLSPQGTIKLSDLLRSIWTDDSLLFKIRLYMIIPEALNERDQIIFHAVFNNIGVFAGTDPIFDGPALQLVQYSRSAVRFNLDQIHSYWGLLSEYAAFKQQNSLKLDLLDYAALIAEEDDKDGAAAGDDDQGAHPHTARRSSAS